jgi:hypothetical protein
MNVLVPNVFFLNQIKLKRRIRKLEAQLKVANRILRYYGNSDIWHYRDVKTSEKNPVYTSFETLPLKDGWLWAQEALEKINSIRRRNATT